MPLGSIKLPKDTGSFPDGEHETVKPEHAVISTFDLFSIGGEYFVVIYSSDRLISIDISAC